MEYFGVAKLLPEYSFMVPEVFRTSLESLDIMEMPQLMWPHFVSMALLTLSAAEPERGCPSWSFEVSLKGQSAWVPSGVGSRVPLPWCSISH